MSGGLPGDILGLGLPLSFAPFCVSRGEERQVEGSPVGRAWPGRGGASNQGLGGSCLLDTPPMAVVTWFCACACACVHMCVSVYEELRRRTSWGGALASAVCLLFTLPTACRGGSAAMGWEGGAESIPPPSHGNRASLPLVSLQSLPFSGDEAFTFPLYSFL